MIKHMINHKNTIGFFTLLISALTVYAGSLKLLKVTNVTIEISGLSSELDGLKLLHITDLHSNSPVKMNLDIWKKIKTLDFDIACITGDIVDRNAYQIEPHLNGLKELCGRVPVYFAEGNHDHYSMKRLMPYFDEAGVTVLVDNRTSYKHNGKTVDIIGVSDFYTANHDTSAELFSNSYTGNDNIEAYSYNYTFGTTDSQSLSNDDLEDTAIEENNLKIVLMHQPQHIDYVDIGKGPALVLSGHTHGGQIRLPFLPTLYAPYQGFLPKYGCGTYNFGSAKLFVSKGIGYTGKAPLRFWNRPEICIITLKAV